MNEENEEKVTKITKMYKDTMIENKGKLLEESSYIVWSFIQQFKNRKKERNSKQCLQNNVFESKRKHNCKRKF